MGGSSAADWIMTFFAAGAFAAALWANSKANEANRIAKKAITLQQANEFVDWQISVIKHDSMSVDKLALWNVGTHKAFGVRLLIADRANRDLFPEIHEIFEGKDCEPGKKLEFEYHWLDLVLDEVNKTESGKKDGWHPLIHIEWKDSNGTDHQERLDSRIDYDHM